MLQETFSIKTAQKFLGLGKTKIYELLKSGEIPAKKVGNRTLILKKDLENFLENLQKYPTEMEGEND